MGPPTEVGRWAHDGGQRRAGRKVRGALRAHADAGREGARQNDIIEHTDYSEGSSCCAIDNGVAVAFAPEPDGKCRLFRNTRTRRPMVGLADAGRVGRIDLADPGAALDALPVGHWGNTWLESPASLVESACLWAGSLG